jgi:hypothetical protein
MGSVEEVALPGRLGKPLPPQPKQQPFARYLPSGSVRALTLSCAQVSSS